MRTAWLALLFCVFAPWAAAQQGDPIHSRECIDARAELESALDEAAVAHQRSSPRLAAARQKAATTCLGRSGGKAERSGAPEPVQSVPPPVIAARAATQPLVIASPLPPLDISRPATVTACDPAGCWDTQGRRLNQTGPVLMGPRGICSLQGGVVVCP